jgi:hypothetical protein
MPPTRPRRPIRSLGTVALLAATLGAPAVARAYSICQEEIESITRGARGVPMTEQQKLEFAPLMEDAIKRCRIGREDIALTFFAKARSVVGMPPRRAVDADEAEPPKKP